MTDFLHEIEEVDKAALKCFLQFTKNVFCGVKNPNPNLEVIDEDMSDTKYALQSGITQENIIVFLLIISKVHKNKREKKKAIQAVLSYAQKEVIPQAIFISKYLLMNTR